MRFDVAIVGGGVIGWSCAWHLLRRSPALTVAVIEPNPEASAALRGTGGARAQFGSRVNVELSIDSIEELKRFREEVGHDIGFRQVGYLLFTADENRAAAMGAAVKLQRECGVIVKELSGAQIGARAPYLATEDLVYGTVCETDGLLSAPDVLKGYHAAGLRLGAVEVRAKALGIGEGVVATSVGDVAAREVVLATGQWSAEMGLDLPVRPEMHQLYVMPVPSSFPDDAPMIVDCDTTFHFRRRGGEVLMGVNDPELAERIVPPSDGQPEFDPNVFDGIVELGRHRCPILFDARPQPSPQGWAGCYSVTPDHHAILGQYRDLVVATGFGGHGVMHSPAAGRIVASLILDGSTNQDISDLDPARFQASTSARVDEKLVF